MSSSSVEVSFDTSTLLDSQAADTSCFLESDLCHSPTKRDGNLNVAFHPCLLLSPESTPDLKCLLLFSNELFLMTQHLREEGLSGRNCSPKKTSLSSLIANQEDERLRNDKIEKLLGQLSDDTEGDFDIDSDLRSRAFPSRFQKKSLDAFDVHLDNYLQEPKKLAPDIFFNENKENFSHMAKPSKRKLMDSGPKATIRKRRSTPPLPKMPQEKGFLTKSLVNSTAFPKLQSTSLKSVLETSPHRICVPRCISLPKTPALKFRKNNSIFLVDSLTGSVSDATQFGTELNSSNCEGFPLPDDVNEVVQIPTNSAGPLSNAPKMAIIKATYSKRLWSKEIKESEKIGFYSKREFEEVKLHTNPQMTVYNDKKNVRWADDLEW